MFCKYCGNQLKPKNGKCSICGHELDRLEGYRKAFDIVKEINNQKPLNNIEHSVGDFDETEFSSILNDDVETETSDPNQENIGKKKRPALVYVKLSVLLLGAVFLGFVVGSAIHKWNGVAKNSVNNCNSIKNTSIEKESTTDNKETTTDYKETTTDNKETTTDEIKTSAEEEIAGFNENFERDEDNHKNVDITDKVHDFDE